MYIQPTAIETIFEKVEDYSKTTIELVTLKAIDKTADIVSSLAITIILFIVFASVALLVSIGLAIWLGTLTGALYNGFFIMAGVYMLIGLVVYIFRKDWIKTSVSNSLIDSMLKSNKE